MAAVPAYVGVLTLKAKKARKSNKKKTSQKKSITLLLAADPYVETV